VTFLDQFRARDPRVSGVRIELDIAALERLIHLVERPAVQLAKRGEDDVHREIRSSAAVATPVSCVSLPFTAAVTQILFRRHTCTA
jgi:hypothetical protein